MGLSVHGRLPSPFGHHCRDTLQDCSFTNAAYDVLLITLVILKITWDSWRTIRASEPGERVS
jgi:hypothetical protein